MKILVTGADGMLGSNLVRELLERGHSVCAFLLPDSNAPTLQGLDIEFTYGNILDVNQLTIAASGCDAIIHTAANTNIWPNRSDIVRKVNVEGTRNVISAALAAHIKKMVYVGTANSFGFGSKQTPGNEKQPYRSAKYGLDYMDSKYDAQQLVLNAVKDKNLPAVIVNPTFMWGPYDSKPGAGAMILAIYQGKIPVSAPGGRNYIYVKDVVVAIANALEKGTVGDCYIAGNENLNYKEAFDKIAKVVGVKPPGMKIPGFLTKAYGWAGTSISGLTGKPPTVSYAMAQISCDEHYFSAEKAVKELGMPQTNIEVAIQECFAWLKENGYCGEKEESTI
ncbi:MAG: NAD-dependent epimerase/dehydratase family protein [Saprospiraceae bacterium]